MSQTELADALGRQRQWVAALETGVNRRGNPVPIEMGMASKLSMVLNIPVQEVCLAAGLPYEEWPVVSNTSTIRTASGTLDISTLTPSQIGIIEQLIVEFTQADHTREEHHDQPHPGKGTPPV